LIERILRSLGNRLTIVEASESIESYTNREVLELALGFANHLRGRGVTPGTRVCIAAPTSLESVVSILAAWINGAAVSVLPSEIGTRGLSAEKFLSMVGYLRAAVLIGADSVRLRLGVHQPHCDVLPASEAVRRKSSLDILRWVPPPPDETAILQFTSGSTGSPKASVVTHGMLAHNCEAIMRRVKVQNRDVALSWLPLHHDMGMSVITGFWWCNVGHLVLMPTSAFVRHPLLWLQMIARFKATLSAAPMFAYAMLARLSRSLDDADMDLSSWRYAWVGAEPVFERSLIQFREAVRRFGMSSTALQPAYGMAESVVAISMGQADYPYRVVHADRQELFLRSRVEFVPPDHDMAVTYVSNGPPVDGMRVRIVSESGEPLAEQRVGRIRISGPSVIQRYFDHRDARDPSDWFDTGDLGFIYRGEIFVTGRHKDLIIRAGVNISPHLIEWTAETCLGLKSGHSVAFSHLDPAAGREEIVVILGIQPGAPQADEMRTRLAREVAQQVGVQVDRIVFVRRSAISQTTSGKLRRSQMKADYAKGNFAGPGVPEPMRPHFSIL